MQPQVIRSAFLDMQVCVPEYWLDSQVKAFANIENPCGTEHGWQIRKQGDPALEEDPERNDCAGRPGFVHIMLDA